MTEPAAVVIRKLATGVPGLDDVLGGGLPELSFNLIVGGPGSGKTTLAHQIVFANATPDRPGLYFTIIGEPPLKMLRYQQQYTFFDPAKVNGVIRFASLSEEVEQGLTAVLDSIIRQITAANPGFVVVDSFRSAMRETHRAGHVELEVQEFIQKLALHLAAWEATSFLVGEFAEPESQAHPAYTVADGLIVLSQKTERNSVVRKLRVTKMRGQGDLPGLHTFRITRDGLKVFPRLPKPEDERQAVRQLSETIEPITERLSTGVSGLDEMLNGGVPRGYSVMIAGPSGSGKTVLSAQFIAEGAKQGEHGVLAIFEKRPTGYLQTTSLGRDLAALIRDGKVTIVYLRPLDLSVDETLFELREAVQRTGAQRVVIDSLSGFEMAVSPGFREDFRESLYRLVGVLTGLGVTVLMTLEIEDAYTELRLGPRENAFLADAIILQRYVELQGELKRVMTVIKVRASDHSKDLRLYEAGSEGLTVHDVVHRYDHGLLTADPTAKPTPPRSQGARRRSRKSGGMATDRPSLLDQLRDANEQLVVASMRAQDLADQADASRIDAETANRLKDEFVAVVSHELRTPLNAILGWAHLLGRGQLDPARTQDGIHTIERNAKALARIIDDLLDISRIIGGGMRIDPRPVDLVAVIQGALDEIRLVAEAKGVGLAFTCSAVPDPVGGDTLRLHQVVVNLLSNAVKFTPAGGHVEVRLSSPGSQAQIQVADTGQGIAPEFVPHLFERFTQADASTQRRQGGIGLGLAIVKGLVEQHGGIVHADSSGLGKGATFTIRIPVLARRHVDAVDQRDSAETPAQAPARIDGISVLLVEDDADSRHVLTTILELAGARVQAAGSVREALLALEDRQPDVLVSDIGMPDEDGYALIRQVRRRDHGADIPAIAVTGYVSPEDHARLRAAGFQLHLPKPVEPCEVVAAVASAVGLGPAAA